MTIRITQPDAGMASHSVHIFIDGIRLGSIGPGDTISGQTAADEYTPWKVTAVCGLLRAELSGLGDADLLIQWSSRPAAMEIRRAKDL